MKDQSFFSSGQNIVLRQVFRGRIWSAGPEIVVQDAPELLVFYIMPGAIVKRPHTLSGERIKPHCKISGEYNIKDIPWGKNYCLRLKIPGSDYSVELFFNLDMVFLAWYINLETPFRRIPTGFEYTDEELDIILKPDLSSWQWKDEDELEEAITCGLTSPERATYLHKEGERVANGIQSGKSPFNGWEKWRPDPSWKVPILPEGWDVL